MTTAVDPRAIALARYLRATAQDFSEMAEAADMVSVAEAGMVLLDAADIAAAWTATSPGLVALSRAGLFDTGEDGRTRFRATDAIREELRRGLFAGLQAPRVVLAGVLDVAERPGPWASGGTS